VLPHNNPKPVPFVRTAFDEIEGRFSPDGRWVAYVSNQSGLHEVHVRGFATDFSSGSASTGGTTLVSRGGGNAPRWRGDGRELFYLALPRTYSASCEPWCSTSTWRGCCDRWVGDDARTRRDPPKEDPMLVDAANVRRRPTTHVPDVRNDSRTRLQVGAQLLP
jgi:hypothetical protein